MGVQVEARRAERPFARIFDWFDAPDVAHFFEGVRPFDDRMRVEEEIVDDHLVIRAEMPGVDPDKDVEISIDDGVMTVRAERRQEDRTTTSRGFRTEFRYGSFRRTMALPKGTSAKAVTATYRDGILEIRVPAPSAPAPVAKIAINRS